MTTSIETLGIGNQQIFINNKWLFIDGDAIVVNNPSKELEIGRIAETPPSQIDDAVQAAMLAYPEWSATPAPIRARYLIEFMNKILDHRDHLASLLTAEQGKPISEAKDEVSFAIAFLQNAAESARRLEGEILPGDTKDEQIYIHRVPYGVVAGITAWNFPIALFCRKVGPALVTGNTIVVKPHELTPLTSLALAEIARQAGIPKGVLNVITGKGPTVGDSLVKHPSINLISMTGSVRAGREIYAAASKDIKSIRLELGGKAPFIVLADADVDKAVEAAVQSKFVNGGQVCTANDRMFIEEAVYDEFVNKLLNSVKALKIGNPEDAVDMGPRASPAEVKKLRTMVERAKEQGADVLLDMNLNLKPSTEYENGCWFYPVVFEVNSTAIELMQEETFGPIATVMKVSSLDDAIKHSNESQYGLSAYLFTNENRSIMRCLSELQFGEIFVNRGAGESVHAFHSGYKLSGIGGEDGKHGIEGYLRKKTIYNNFS